jgi:hypothetical protein
MEMLVKLGSVVTENLDVLPNCLDSVAQLACMAGGP